MVYRVELLLFAITLGVVCQGCIHGLKSSAPADWFNTKWTYNESDAAIKDGLLPPSRWKDSFPLCDANMPSAHQSPIDIKHADVPKNNSGVLPLIFHNCSCDMTYRNIGSTISGMPTKPEKCNASFTTLSGTVYKFYEAHIHWHQYYNHRGTEHKVDGQAEAVEAHLVHYDASFKSMEEALESHTIGAVAVVAIRYTVAPSGENATESIAFSSFVVPTYPALVYMDTNFSVAGDEMNVYDLIGNALPRTDLPMYHYNGSLTTPVCDSVVSWYIVQQTVMLSQSQVHQLRLFSHVNKSEAEKQKLGFNNDANVRPVAPLNGRLVVAWPYIVDPNVSSDSAPESSDDSGLKTWQLGLIIGGSVLVAGVIIGLLVFMFVKCCRARQQYESVEGGVVNSSA